MTDQLTRSPPLLDRTGSSPGRRGDSSSSPDLQGQASPPLPSFSPEKKVGYTCWELLQSISIFYSGFVYYEVDCFWFLKNPYVPIDVPEPTLAMENQKDLVGEGRQERQEAVTKYEASQKEDELTEEEKKKAVEKYYALLSENIKTERQRIGGDWAVAGFLCNKRERDLLREFLGNDLTIVMLNLPESVIKERLVKRCGSDQETLEYLLVLNYIELYIQ